MRAVLPAALALRVAHHEPPAREVETDDMPLAPFATAAATGA